MTVSDELEAEQTPTWRQRLCHPALAALLLAAVTFAVFFPVLGHDFVNFDDPDYVTSNAEVKQGLSWQSLRWAFVSGHAANWHPLTWLSHILDCQAYGLKAGGHHLTSLLIHTTSAVLLFLTLSQLTRGTRHRLSHLEQYSPRPAGPEPQAASDSATRLRAANGTAATHITTWRCAFVAALFALHPLHVESVAWIAERKDVLSGLFFVLTIWAYGRYAGYRVAGSPSLSRNENPPSTGPENGVARGVSSRPGSIYYALALLFFAFGLMSKPMLVTLPFVLILLDCWPLNRIGMNPSASGINQVKELWRLCLEKTPFFVLSLASCLVTFHVQRQGGAVQSLATVSLGARLENALVSYVRYVAKAFWPFDLATPYPYQGHWSWPLVVAGTLLVAGVSLGAFWLAWRKPAYSFVVTGWFWFVGMLVPVIGLVQVGDQAMADRYTYLPLIGLFIIVAWGWKPEVHRRREPAETPACGAEQPTRDSDEHPAAPIRCDACGAGKRSPERAFALWVTTATVLVLLCALRTRDQLHHWQNSETLFRHAAAVVKDNWLAYYNLAWYFDSRGRFDEAIAGYRQAVSLQPKFSDAWNNLGCALVARKQSAEAARCFEAVLALKPDDLDARRNLARCLNLEGKTDLAVEQYQLALRRRPDDKESLNRLGDLLNENGQFAEAARNYEASLRIEPQQPVAHYSLGHALVRLRKGDQAIPHFEAALTLKPDYAEAHRDLGIALAVRGQLDSAIKHFRDAVRAKPEDAAMRCTLGKALVNHQQPNEALSEFTEALRLSPTNAEAHAGLGLSLAMKGDLNAAVPRFEEALRLRPSDPVTHLNLGKALVISNRTNDAILHFTEALRLKPNYADAQRELDALKH